MNDNDIKVNRQVNISATLTLQPIDIENQIKEGYKTDVMAQNILTNKPANFNVTQKGLIEYKELIYVSNRHIRDQLLQNYHDLPTGGHQGVERTYERLSENYYWPNMRKQVKDYVRTCDLYWKSTAQRHQPYGYLQPIETPLTPWTHIAWDFVTGLPQSTDHTHTSYDSILVITDKKSKGAIFEPWKENWGAEELASVFQRVVYRKHGLPEHIISDRGTQFNNKFWLTLTAKLGIKNKMSTAYHPQTDGQTERLNQTLELYLRCYVNYEQNDWVQHLAITEFSYNSAKHTTTGISPFTMIYGFNPDTQHEPLSTNRFEYAPPLRQNILKHYNKKPKWILISLTNAWPSTIINATGRNLS